MDEIYNRLGGERIRARQINELIGIARGIAADGAINQAEADFLYKWLAANLHISNEPVIHTLCRRVEEMLADGNFDPDEARDLLDTLNQFSDRSFEIGEVLKAATLPVCDPAPILTFPGRRYCFTGTFSYGQRNICETATASKGAATGSLTKKTDVLVIGLYATESWKHSSFGNKIIKACEMRDQGVPISIVSEDHWVRHL